MSRTLGQISISLVQNPSLDAWIGIGEDETIRVSPGKVELGQGIRSALARIAAEELDVDLSRIRVSAADTATSPNEIVTAGSQSIEASGSAVRHAAAAARALLVERAARHLGVSADALAVEDGVVRAREDSGAKVSYWELMAGRPFEHVLDGSARPKDPAQHRIVGRPGPRIDLPALVCGAPVFVQDLELPGMVHARVVRPPSYTARLRALDRGAVAGLPGLLELVVDGSFVAVVCAREDQAVAAREVVARKCTWNAPKELPGDGDVIGALRQAPVQSAAIVDGSAVEGPIPAIEPPPEAARTLRASYSKPYQMHASLGPSAAVAQLVDGKLTVWSSTQSITLLRGSIAQALEIAPGAVRVVHVPGPGCYGHNGSDDVAFEAALVATILPGPPVKLQWMREDEHGFEPYAPAMHVEIAASLDATGRVIDWNHDVRSTSHMGRPRPYRSHSGFIAAQQRERPLPRPETQPPIGPHSGGYRNADPLYTFPRRRIVHHFVAESPLRTSSTRGLGAYANVFALESMMDELAHAAACDPAEFRLRHLEDARACATVEAACERAGWSGPRRADGRGIAFAQYKNQKCYTTVIVDIEIDRGIRVVRAVVAADAGQIIDPDGLANQLQGGVVQSTSWTLCEAVTFDHTHVTSRDWDGYPILRMRDAPSVETVLIDRPEHPALGAGEATQGPTAAAIANAFFDATGVRLRDVPFTRDRVIAAL